jgi:hypothetical protein
VAADVVMRLVAERARSFGQPRVSDDPVINGTGAGAIIPTVIVVPVPVPMSIECAPGALHRRRREHDQRLIEALAALIREVHVAGVAVDLHTVQVRLEAEVDVLAGQLDG